MKIKESLVVWVVLILILSVAGISIGFTENTGETNTEEVFFSGGDGSEDNPYLIEDVYDLQNISEDLGAHYELSSDIDASVTENWNDGKGFEPIGDSNIQFFGSLDGKGYEIIDLYIDRPEIPYVGLFSAIDQDGIVENIGVARTRINGDYTVGGLVGSNRGLLKNSYITGKLEGEDNHVGGLVGQNFGKVSNCHTNVDVSSSASKVGGLVGDDFNTIYNSYSIGNVSGGGEVGGLVGHNRNILSNSYSFANVKGNGNVGGLVGLLGVVKYNESGHVTQSYSIGDVQVSSDRSENIGGLVGYLEKGEVKESYWDKEASEQSTSDGGTGLTTAEMIGTNATENMTGFDFEESWETVEGEQLDAEEDGYPILQINSREEQLKAQDIFVPPPLLTHPAEEITTNSALLKGELTDLGEDDEVEAYFQYRQDGEDDWSETYPQNITEPQKFDESVTDLQSYTKYEFRAIAEGNETKEGYIRTFTTDPIMYELNIEVDGGGTIEVNGEEVAVPFEREYIEGAEVEIEARSEEGWMFDEWTEDHESKEKEITLTMETDKNVTAHFEEILWEIVNLSPSTGEKVNGDNLTVSGEMDSPKGLQLVNSTVKLEGVEKLEADIEDNVATVDVPVFISEGERTYEMYMEDETGYSQTEEVTFQVDNTPPELDLTIINDVEEEDYAIEGETDPEAQVWVNEEEIEVDNNGYFTYTTTLESGETLMEVIAEDEAGNRVVRSFTAVYLPQLSTDTEGDGTVETEIVDENEIETQSFSLELQKSDKGSFEAKLAESQEEDEINVKLKAIPDEGWEFKEWKGDYEGTEDEITVTIEEDSEEKVEIIAVFEEEVEEEVSGFTSLTLVLGVLIAVAIYRKKKEQQ